MLASGALPARTGGKWRFHRTNPEPEERQYQHYFHDREPRPIRGWHRRGAGVTLAV
jgi:hypothetical protein